MTNALKSKIAKAGLGVVAGLSMLLSGVSVAGALTQAEATNIISTLGLTGAQAAAVQAQVSGGAMMTTSGYQFNTNLSLGMTSTDVMHLQQVLNSDSATALAVTAGSNGSIGHESNYYGPATVAAVKKFQAKHGISTLGNVGPATRAALNAMGGTSTGGTTTLPAGCTSTSGFSSTTGMPCSGGTSTTLPAGCASASGFSSTTGLPCGNGTSTGTQTGPITAALAQDNPAQSTIVAGQATADLMHVTFMGTGTVNSVTLSRNGISNQSTLSNVYLYDGVTRLTDGYSFNTNGTITINNLNLAVAGSRTISVKADVAVADYSVGVTLTGFTAGTSVNAVNIKGNEMFIASGSTLAYVTIAPGTNSVTAATVNAGVSSYAVWRQALQVNTRTLWLKAANFRVTGSAPSDTLANVYMYVDGVKTGDMAMMNTVNGSNYLSFNMSAAPVALTTGSHTLEVRGDIAKGSSYNFTVALQQSSDLMIMDPQVGVNLLVCGVYGVSSCTTSYTQSSGGTITVGSGSATIVIDPTFNAMSNITGGSSNATIAKFKVHGYGEDVKVTSLSVTPVIAGTTPAAAGLQNVTLYFNGSQVGTQQSWTSGPLTFTLGSQLIIPAGADSMLEVRADLRTTGGVNYTVGTVSANVNAGSGNAEGWNSKSTISFPTSGATGNTLTMQSGLLAVAKNTGYANQTQNPNTPGVKIGSFVLQNQSSSEGVRVTSLTVGLNTTVAGPTFMTSALTNLSGLKTSETSGSGATPVQPQASNVFSVDFTLAPGATKTVDIFADTSSATAVTVIPTLAVTGLGSISNTSITVAAVQGQTITLSAGSLATPTLLTASATKAQYIAAGDPMNTGTGAVDATKASYTFVSTGGTSTISELKFTISGTANTPVMSVRVGTVTAPVVAGVAWLQGLNLVVPNGGSGLNVDAFVTYAPVGTSGETPGNTATTTLTYVKYSSGGVTTPVVVSVGAPTMTLVGSKPTLTVSTTTNTGLVISGVGKIGEVTIAADAKGNIKINKLVFTVSSSGFSTAPTAVTSPVISDSNSSSSVISGAVCTAASLVVTCTLDTDANASLTNFDGYSIAAGTSKTFSLFGSTNGVATGSGTPTITSSVAASTFNWDDASTNGTGGTGTNLNGLLLDGFPNGSYSIKQ